MIDAGAIIDVAGAVFALIGLLASFFSDLGGLSRDARFCLRCLLALGALHGAFLIVGETGLAQRPGEYEDVLELLLPLTWLVFFYALAQGALRDALAAARTRERHINEELDRRLGDALAERDRMQAALHEQELREVRLATMGRVTAIVAHELRNPLGTIGLATASLLRDARSDDPAGTRQLRRIERSVARCSRIVSQLLDFARTDTPRLDWFDLEDLIAQALEDYVVDDGIDVRQVRHGALRVYWDRDQIWRVLVNLLDNAVHAVKVNDGGKVVIEAFEDAGTVSLCVIDDGTGIPPEELDRLQQDFVTTKAFGIGVGLSIIEQIAHAHAGRFHLEPGEAGGVRATLRLPVRPV